MMKIISITAVSVILVVLSTAVFTYSPSKNTPGEAVFDSLKAASLCDVGTIDNVIDQNVAATNLETVNSKLSDLYKKGLLNNNVETYSLLKERKKLLLQLMKSNPDKALSYILDEGNREAIVSEIGCIEQEETVEGTLEVFHTDNLDGTGTYEYFITSNGKKLFLHPANDLSLISGSKIRVKGFKLDDDMLLDVAALGSQNQNIELLYTPDLSLSGVQKVAVLLVNFQNTAQPSFGKNYVEDAFSNVNAYYKKNSYGKISLQADVYGWYKIPISSTCVYSTVLTESIKIADKAIDFRKYSRIVVVAPFKNCDWYGVSSPGKILVLTNEGAINTSVAWIASGPFKQQTGIKIIAHELGHGFGNGHAKSIDCQSVSITKTFQGCTFNEYGDVYDVMGQGSLGHFNAPHKEVVGWLNESSIMKVTQSGTYKINTLESSVGIRAIKIQREPEDRAYNYMYLEYRQPLNYDNNFAKKVPRTDVYDGALIHVGTSSTLLVDASPVDTNDVYKSVLKLGSILIDPLTQTSIKVVSKNSNSMTFEIEIGKIDFTVPYLLIKLPADESNVSGTVEIKADASDAFGIDKVEFYVDDNLISTDYSEPYSSLWNTSLEPKCDEIVDPDKRKKCTKHHITVNVYDKSDYTNSESIRVYIQE